MAPTETQLVVGWSQSQLDRICQLIWQRFPDLQNLQYGQGTGTDVKIEAKTISPTFLMPEYGDTRELYMFLR